MPKVVQLDTTQLSDEQEQRVKELGVMGICSEDPQRVREAVLITVDLNAAMDCCMDDTAFSKQRALHVAEIEEARKAGRWGDGLRRSSAAASAAHSASASSSSAASSSTGSTNADSTAADRAGKRPVASSSGQLPSPPSSSKRARPEPSSKGKGKASLAVPQRGSHVGVPPEGWPANGVTYTPFLLWGDAKGRVSDGDKLRLQYASCMPLVAARVQRLPKGHPCFDPDGGTAHGLYATRAVERGEVVGCYTGVVSPRTKESDEDIGSQYVMAIDQQTSGRSRTELLIDAAEYGNETRYINDFHSISTDGPNCRFETGRDDAGEVCVRVVVERRVEEKGELLVNYGNPFWQKYVEEAMRNIYVIEVQIKPVYSMAFTISVDTSDGYVPDLKIGIKQAKPEWNGKFMQLIHNGKELRDNQKLADISLCKGATIHLRERPPVRAEEQEQEEEEQEEEEQEEEEQEEEEQEEEQEEEKVEGVNPPDEALNATSSDSDEAGD